jgi:hypothetical protein
MASQREKIALKIKAKTLGRNDQIKKIIGLESSI